MDEVFTPIRHKSRREAKRSARVGHTALDSLYNTKVSKRNKTSINSYISLTLAR